MAILIDSRRVWGQPLSVPPLVDDADLSKMELVAAHVALLEDNSGSFLTVATLYYPPYRPDTNSLDSPHDFQRLFQLLTDLEVDILTGDFNAWHPLWCSSPPSSG